MPPHTVLDAQTGHLQPEANIVAFLAAAQRRGIVIERVPSDPSGQVDVDAVATGSPELLKMSVHYTTTMDELTTAVAMLAGAISGR